MKTKYIILSFIFSILLCVGSIFYINMPYAQKAEIVDLEWENFSKHLDTMLLRTIELEKQINLLYEQENKK